MRMAAIALLLCATCTPLEAQSPGELVDRTLAIVGGRPVTLSDVQTAMGLGLAESADDVETATEKLVERTLILREVERYAPTEPAPAEIDAQLAAIRQRLSEQRVVEILAAGGFTDSRLRAWLRDDLRIAAYLTQRFAASADVTVEPVTPELRERLSAERRASLIADWIADLRRRTPVVELWKR